MIDRRMALAREWDELVDQVRALPGFEDFLRPPPLTKLLPAASDGPVAVINVSRWRCDALLVTSGEVHVQPLPGLRAQEVEERVVEYLRVLDAAGQTEAEYQAARAAAGSDASAAAEDRLAKATVERLRAGARAEAMLRLILIWLWETIAQPVLRALGLEQTPPEGTKWPRMWWCPTGLLTLLPLHAAGDHQARGADRPTVLDRVVSSYTPTLRALVEARETPSRAPAAARLLAVTVGEVEGEVSLRTVVAERDALRERFGDQCTVRDGSDATVPEITKLLPEHRWVHFSCHGNQYLDDPSRGGLRLFDDVLTIAAISAGRYEGEFAFLPACKTATGGFDLADEAITLAAALHYTGYRHVIGTLWTVFEGTAAKVARAVYGSDAAEFDPSLSAGRLHEVQRELRDTDRLSAWTPFTHIGP